jgi:hypothetical protein
MLWLFSKGWLIRGRFSAPVRNPELYQASFGIPDPPAGALAVWATRLLEFQFADIGNDPELRKEVDVIAPAMII